jgi:hypothetical protein
LENDWKKLTKILKFLTTTREVVTTVSMDESSTVKWYIDSFGVHKDLKNHTGAVLTLGNGVLGSISTKQKVNSRSLTEAEQVNVHLHFYLDNRYH